MEYLKDLIYLDNISYPGKCKKTGVITGGIEYILKFSDSEAERINLISEEFGISLCNQLLLETSHVKLVTYENKLCLMSEKWAIQENEQFFPLASFYEELLDEIKQVTFTYSLFKEIVKKKAPSIYDDILYTFWGQFIVDYLICNSRTAGNIGFLHDGNIRLAPIFDCSTSLESLNDCRFKDLSFPQLRMIFNTDIQSGYNVLCNFQDLHKGVMLEKAHELINLDKLNSRIASKEEKFMFNVISYRYNQLYK